ncbi:TonB family protein [Myxococcus llanfairpwllgwyngyllgogerychwyrndrobwllllantysiliogogogochensis]|uniref:TonB family protein n=1 Tax=Myxococcus llanfairpwllgwyngyllgogerychwyrndrobwllllantysiliogogogochensis TaxID=2590453 RepID=A0A540X1U2_9BACT|nr:TonB family protein [Myxococcus llanfairpwllgwyngyllgogerychwyrndrobwllllantysiliogogogochensis]TQF15219.1 TonB family protein [Myxococcus llanfairpwllgwyngyllgogerychwyrndrobwllllantysiliogogogochensis]
MPDESPKDGHAEAPLFASVAHARSRRVADNSRTFWVVPLAVAIHVLALVGLDTLWHGSTHAPRLVTKDDDTLVLRLLAAPPPPPPAPAASTPSTPRQASARRARPLSKPHPSKAFTRPSEPRPLPAPAAPPPHETADAKSANEARATATPGGVSGGVAGGVIGGVVNSVLAASSAGLLPVAQPPPSREERNAWEEEYFEVMFRDRFENVRYPHQAAMAGIEGRFSLRITVGARGQLLELSVVGHCPHSVLCDAAQAAVRDAAPFPPPPAALGPRVTVELPFNYHLR